MIGAGRLQSCACSRPWPPLRRPRRPVPTGALGAPWLHDHETPTLD